MKKQKAFDSLSDQQKTEYELLVQFLELNKEFLKAAQQLSSFIKSTQEKTGEELFRNKNRESAFMNFEKMHKVILGKQADFECRWGVKLLDETNPNRIYEFQVKGLRFEVSSALIPGSGLLEVIARDFRKLRLFSNAPVDKNLTTLKIQIQLSKPRSQIMRELKSVIEMFKKARKEKNWEVNNRTRLSHYEECLSVYKLKNKNKDKTWTEIGKMVFKGVDEAALIQKTRRAYKTCEGMIKKGYMQLL